MKQTIPYERLKPTTVDGDTIKVSIYFSSFDKEEIDKLSELLKPEVNAERIEYLEIKFNNKSTITTDGDILNDVEQWGNLESELSYYWSFGDGKTSSEKDVVHLYEKPGKYQVTLVATNDTYYSSSSKVSSYLGKIFFTKYSKKIGLPNGAVLFFL